MDSVRSNNVIREFKIFLQQLNKALMIGHSRKKSCLLTLDLQPITLTLFLMILSGPITIFRDKNVTQCIKSVDIRFRLKVRISTHPRIQVYSPIWYHTITGTFACDCNFAQITTTRVLELKNNKHNWLMVFRRNVRIFFRQQMVLLHLEIDRNGMVILSYLD